MGLSVRGMVPPGLVTLDRHRVSGGARACAQPRASCASTELDGLQTPERSLSAWTRTSMSGGYRAATSRAAKIAAYVGNILRDVGVLRVVRAEVMLELLRIDSLEDLYGDAVRLIQPNRQEQDDHAGQGQRKPTAPRRRPEGGEGQHLAWAARRC